MTEARFTVESTGERLDRFLAGMHPALSRSQLQKLIAQGLVTVNDRRAKASLRLAPGDTVRVLLPPPEPAVPLPEDIPLNIVYEDAELLVVDKPAGMTVHPAPGEHRHTLVNALLAHCPSIDQGARGERPGIVHRLDKDTSGLMVVAKTPSAHEGLVEQFRSRSVVKTYLALVVGHVTPKTGAIEAPVGRDTANRKRMGVVEGGREARTRYRVTEYFGDHSLLEVTPETGRTHQIRVHLAAIGHPVAGDRVYGRRSPYLARQFLHAARLAFRHPMTSEYLDFTTPLPPDLQQALARLPKLGD
ncbi:MAG: RluA family pseudouridine synthase [Chloroflexota bacterium]